MQEPVPALLPGPTKRKRGRPKNEVKRPKTTLLHMWGLAEKAKPASADGDEPSSGRQDEDIATIDSTGDTETHGTASEMSGTPLQVPVESTAHQTPLNSCVGDELEIDIHEVSSSDDLLLEGLSTERAQTILYDSLTPKEQTQMHLLTEEVETPESRKISAPISESTQAFINDSENSQGAIDLNTSSLERLMGSSEPSQEVVLVDSKLDLDEPTTTTKGSGTKQGRKGKASAIRSQSLRQYFGLTEPLEPEVIDLTDSEKKESKLEETIESMELKIEQPMPIVVAVNPDTPIASSGPKKPIHPFFTQKGMYYSILGIHSNIELSQLSSNIWFYYSCTSSNASINSKAST